MRLASCRFAAVLPILTFSVLALAQGTTPSLTTAVPTIGQGQLGLAVNVRPGASVHPPFTPLLPERSRSTTERRRWVRPQR